MLLQVVLIALKDMTKYGKIFEHSWFLSSFLPTIILVSVTALMPVLVGKCEFLIKHWTRSSLNRALLRKTFFFLLFMVLILPSLGLASLSKAVFWTLGQNVTQGWECVILPDRASFLYFQIDKMKLSLILYAKKFRFALLYG